MAELSPEAVAGIVGSLAAAFYAGWKGWKGRSKASPSANAQNTIIAGDIMDTRPMKELVIATGKLSENVALHAAAQDRAAAASDRAAAASDRAAEAAHRAEATMRDLCQAIERKL